MGTAVALLTARVWVLCGGDGAMSTGTGCLSAGVGVRRGVAGSLSNWRGTICMSVGYVWWGWFLGKSTMVLSASTGSTIFSKDRVFTPTDTAVTPSN